MLKKSFNYASMAITGLFFCVLGFSFIFGSLSPWNWLYYLLVIGISIVGCLRILNVILNFRKVPHRFSLFLDVITWLIAIIISIVNADLFHFLFPRLVGGWILLHAFAKTVTIYIKITDHLPGYLHSVIFLIGDLLFAFALLFMPNQFPYMITLAIGGYFLIYGGNQLLDFVREIIPNNSGEQLDTKLRLAVPPFLAAIIPPTLMRTILNKDAEDQAREDFEVYKSSISADLEVLVHIAPSGPAMLGHVDIIYRGFLMSYGCYDPHQRRLLGTLGDGVVLISPKDEYLYNSLANENKILVDFGIALNEKQKEALNARLLEVFSELVDFESDEQLKQAGKSYLGELDDYISRVTRTCPDTRFYKYREGKFKTFFVLSSNCVFFIAHILSCIGFNLVDMSGIISPGSYFDFLNKQFKSDKSFVISRKIYTKKDANIFRKS